jgi:signal transduction histidine kinase/DNA-binding response OmpR family regulator
MPHDAPSPVPVGRVVDCIAAHVEPFGVFVRLAAEPGVTGFVRSHDWSWTRRDLDLPSLVKPGDVFKAKVLGFRRSSLQLSRRDAEPNPYREFGKNHRVGEAVIGEVKLFSPRAAGVVLLLEGGIDAFVPRSEIPDHALELDGFGLVPQDLVAATILRFGDEGPVLSVKDFLRRRDERHAKAHGDAQAALQYHPSLGVALETLYWQLQLKEFELPEVSPRVREKVSRVLLIEDSAEVSSSLAMICGFFGLEFDAAADADTARRLMAESGHQLLIVDVNLEGGNGFELLQAYGGEPPWLAVFVLTAKDASSWHERLPPALRERTTMLQKPVAVADLLQRVDARLEAVEKGLTGGKSQRLAAHGESSATDQWLPKIAAGSARLWEIERQVEQLRKASKASRAFLLALRPGPIFTLVAGSFPELRREVQQSLEVSPVGDLIRERGLIYLPDIGQRISWFRHLLDVLPLASFAGVALPHEDQARYGLFLAGDQPGQIEIGEERLSAAAREISHLLTEMRFEQTLADNQGLLLTGFLSDSLLHEIKNELQALEDFSAVQLLLARRAEGDFKALSPEASREFTRATVGVQGVSRRLHELVVLFRNLAGQAPAERIDLNRSLRRLAETLKPYAEEHGARIVLELDEDLPELFLSPKLVDQPILNLTINAIEQMRLSGGPTRRVHLTTRFHKKRELPVEVCVTDTGQGIHKVDQARIFDLFFTTKNQGTGLGLYVSRLFAERLGGRLELVRSILFAGSEFRLELPRRYLP